MEIIYKVNKNGFFKKKDPNINQIATCLEQLILFMKFRDKDFFLILMNTDHTVFKYPNSIKEGLEFVNKAKEKIIFSVHSKPHLWKNDNLKIRIAFYLNENKSYQYHCISVNKEKVNIIDMQIKALLKPFV